MVAKHVVALITMALVLGACTADGGLQPGFGISRVTGDQPLGGDQRVVPDAAVTAGVQAVRAALLSGGERALVQQTDRCSAALRGGLPRQYEGEPAAARRMMEFCFAFDTTVTKMALAEQRTNPAWTQIPQLRIASLRSRLMAYPPRLGVREVERQAVTGDVSDRVGIAMQRLQGT